MKYQQVLNELIRQAERAEQEQHNANRAAFADAFAAHNDRKTKRDFNKMFGIELQAEADRRADPAETAPENVAPVVADGGEVYAPPYKSAKEQFTEKLAEVSAVDFTDNTERGWHSLT